MDRDPAAGWYYESASSVRWWDGRRWGDARRPVRPPEPPVKQRSPVVVPSWLMVFGFAVCGVGSFLPWVTVFGLSMAGSAGPDGKTIQAWSVIGMIVGLYGALTKNSGLTTTIGGLGALISFGTAMNDTSQVAKMSGVDTTRELFPVQVEVGSGLIVVGIGGMIAIIAAVMCLVGGLRIRRAKRVSSQRLTKRVVVMTPQFDQAFWDEVEQRAHRIQDAFEAEFRKPS